MCPGRHDTGPAAVRDCQPGLACSPLHSWTETPRKSAARPCQEKDYSSRIVVGQRRGAPLPRQCLSERRCHPLSYTTNTPSEEEGPPCSPQDQSPVGSTSSG